MKNNYIVLWNCCYNLILSIAGHEKLFFTIEEFVCKQFDDSRIVSANSRDLIVQALAEFVSNERTLRLLEKIDVDV